MDIQLNFTDPMIISQSLVSLIIKNLYFYRKKTK